MIEWPSHAVEVNSKSFLEEEEGRVRGDPLSGEVVCDGEVFQTGVRQIVYYREAYYREVYHKKHRYKPVEWIVRLKGRFRTLSMMIVNYDDSQ